MADKRIKADFGVQWLSKRGCGAVFCCVSADEEAAVWEGAIKSVKMKVRLHKLLYG